MSRHEILRRLFGTARPLIGMLHVGALPGTPKSLATVAEIAETSLAEARLLAAAGFDALMIENMHDRPYLKRTVGPEIVAAMAVVAREVRREVPLPLGVQVLAGANREAVAVAAAGGASFVRAEGFVFAHLADEGWIESDAAELLRYRRAVGAGGVAIFADVKKKHSSHAVTADVDLAETARAAAFFLADGVIVTGTATGRAADPGEVEAVRGAVDLPVLVGSGITAENLAGFAAADGFIVGSSLKEGGDWRRPIDPARAAAVVRAAAALPAPE